MKLSKTPIIVISMEKNLERKAHIYAHLKEKHKLDFVILNGVDGKKEGQNYLQNQLIKETGKCWYVNFQSKDSKSLTQKECARMGCYLSHLLAMKYAVNEGWEQVVILEDDVVLHYDPNIEMDIPQNTNICYLGGFVENRGGNYKYKVGLNRIHKDMMKYWCCHSYFVNNTKIQLGILKSHRPTALDSFFNRYICENKHGGSYFYYPPLITQSNALPSTIDNKNPFSQKTRYLN